MYIKQFYCCSICDTPYSTKEQAFVCSSEGLDPRYNNITTGEVILFCEETFNSEINKVTKRYLVEGTVLGKIHSPGDRIHHTAIVVDCIDYIRIVVYNREKLFSYPTGKYSKSYLENFNLK